MAYLGVSPSNGVRQKHTYTATANQTSFSGVGAENVTLSYKDSNYVDVYRNGVKLGDADYTSTSGTAIVLAEGAAVNDIVEVIVYDVFSIADAVSKSDGGQFDGNITMASNLNVGGTLTLGSGAVLSEAELEQIDGVTAGTVTASKALVVDSNKDIASLRNITLTGELDAGSLDVSGDADIDGTLEADAITIGGTAISSIYGAVAGSSSIVTTGALNSGSITSGFGTIDTGSSTITTTGAISGGSLTGTLQTAAQTNITSVGTLTTLTVDDITINGSTISDSGDFTLDIGGDITLDADGQQIYLKNNNVHWGTLLTNGTPQNFYIDSTISNGDLIFRGNDGGSTITALTLDMSASGMAVFTGGVNLSSSAISFSGSISTPSTAAAIYRPADNTLAFSTANNERMRIDSSGNLLIGKTTTALATAGLTLGSAGFASLTRSGAEPLNLNRLSSDGSIAVFYKDGTTVGNIGTLSGDLYLGTGTNGFRFLDSDNAIIPVSSADGSTNTNAIDLGASFGKYKDLHLSGGVYVSGTADGNKLDHYEEGTWTPQLTNGSSNIGTTVPSGYNACFTRIGNSVHAEFYIQRSDASSDTNPIILAGLPFAHKQIPAIVGQCWIDNQSSTDIRCFLYLPTNYQQLYFVHAGSSSSYVTFNQFDNARYMYAAFDYLV